jgi:ketosteroid isomerase-like protein
LELAPGHEWGVSAKSGIGGRSGGVMTQVSPVPDALTALAARVQALEDAAGVLQVLMDYRRHVDARDFHAYASLFAADGVWSGSLGTATGPAEIESLLKTALDVYPDDSTREYHLIANPEIVVDGDTASAESTFCLITRGEGDTPVVALVGRYRDALVRAEGRWKFRHRETLLDIPYGVDPALRDGDADR